MDATASSKVDNNWNEVCHFFLRLDNSTIPIPLQKNNTVIKYTKLPDVDLNFKVSWPPGSYTLPPRLRRIIALDDLDLKTNRSLNPDITLANKTMTSSYTRRKIVTICEDEENELHPKFSKGGKRSSNIPYKPSFSNRAVGNDFKEQKHSTKTTSRLSDSSKHIKESKSNAKTNAADNRKDTYIMKMNHRNKFPNVGSQILSDHNKAMNSNKERVTTPASKSTNVTPISISKNLAIPSENEKKISLIKNKVENLKVMSQKKPTERFRQGKSPSQHSKSPTRHSKTKLSYLHEINTKDLKEIKATNKPVMVIHVPLDENFHKNNRIETEISQTKTKSSAKEMYKIDCGTEIDNLIVLNNIKIGTDPLPKKVNQATEMGKEDVETNFNKKIHILEEVIQESFENLEVPNISLTKEKQEEPKKETSKLCSQSLPNLQIPSLKISPNKHENIDDSNFNKSSYIIGRATLTYTTKQKINFQVVGNNDTTSEHSSSPLAYPMNVVSVYKKEIKERESSATETVDTCNERHKPNFDYINVLNGPQTFNCSYGFNNNKLVKPSEIISTIRVNNGLLHSEYICEQFQRELNFIDSFFESLQYLENCSLSNKCFSDSKSFLNNTGIDLKQSEYSSLLSKIENGTNIDDTETMASKSLCLLNLLIRDEQRRAKNLLFVLKMREDALKDFTKSQILWLENKKKQENTDISTLKKKQRGALLKLQHECGEMQRMRKALLTLSEKRKAALMKTKKNIELKLKNNVNLEQILLEKKRLKRSIAGDRNVAPLKCFDLSSSGCDESTTSRPKSITPALVPEATTSIISNTTVTSAEKCIQTGESILGSILVNQSTNTAAENFVVVDGGYLNILFQNLTLPQIFSSGKQYEVNEEALKNIVISANVNNNTLTGDDIVDNFMDQIKHRELDKSSTPSTARSLVDEFDQYYKGLADDDKSLSESPERDYNVSSTVYEIKDALVEATEPIFDNKYKSSSSQSAETIINESSGFKSNDVLTTRSCACEISVTSVGTQSLKGKDSVTSASQTGPLTVPVGATDTTETTYADLPLWLQTKSSPTSTSTDNSSASSQLLCPSASSLSSLASPVYCEAEELRRQQLAIEREIKALEQQQCQLLVVREIPDKPPPPYTPPSDTRTKMTRMFLPDETVEQKVRNYIADPHNTNIDINDAFDAFIKDFCRDTIEQQKSEQADKPWDACNLLPQKQEPNPKKIVEITGCELKEVLTKVPPTVVSGVSTRRSDHIDDILFAEWRRCEPEWTSLHADEVLVKNQVFESIFQKVLTETIDEYKKNVLGLTDE